MFNRGFYAVLIGATVLLSAAVFSQSEEDNTNSGDTAQTNDELFPIDGATREPIVGELYVREVIENWAIRCVKAEDPATEECALFQLLTEDNGSPVAELRMVRLPDGGQAKAGVTFVAPLGTLLTEGIIFKLGEGAPRRFEFSWCEQIGCISRFGLAQADIDAFEKGTSTIISLTPVVARETPLAVTISLDGFADAWGKVTAPQQ